ncbi:MAG: hypothetical protein IKX86_04875 [Clostridia bacterium]|nr:hypothetical protein [Clostridia bacterium]
MIFREKYRARLSDCDAGGGLSPAAVLSMLETVAEHHMESVGHDVIESTRKGVAWIVTGWRLEIARSPLETETLDLSTWAVAARPSFVITRNFEVADADGEVIIRAEAQSALVNVSDGKLQRMTDEIVSVYEPEDRRALPPDTYRLRPAPYPGEALPVCLRYADFDYNGHVHNTRYAELAWEAVPDEMRSRRLCGLRLVYVRAIKRGAEASACVALSGPSAAVSLYSDGEPSAAAEFVFAD